jgi:signal transduction histidine kinase/DNA-binding NarL/FixJ family response regulator
MEREASELAVHPLDPVLESLEQICDMAVGALDASRVIVWRHVPSSRLVFPIAGAVARDPSYSISSLAWRWSQKSVEDIPPFEQSLQTRGAVVATEADLNNEFPAFARELVADSVWCEPVFVGQAVAILTIEPAPRRLMAQTVTRIATSVGALLTWQGAERGRTQAELLLALIEAASEHTGTPGQLLAMVCEQLASQIDVTRASVFLSMDGQLVPRMSSYADGHPDAEAWDLFRSATEPLAIADAAFASQRPVTAVDGLDPRLSRWWLERFGMQAAIAVPLGHPRNPIGVLVLDSPVPRVFRQDDVRLVAAAGTLLGDIIQRVQEAEERESRLSAAGSLRELLKLGLESPDTGHMANRLATVARRAMNTETAVVCLPDENGGLLEAARATLTESAAAAITPTPLPSPEQIGAPIAVTDVTRGRDEHAQLIAQLGLASGIVIPLAGQGGGRGILVCGDTTPRKRSRRRLELAGQIGLEAGLVLEATQLREIDRARQLELQAQAAEATRSAEVKSAFLANMSHEIRTPMNGVLGMNELLLDTEMTAEQREYAEQVARSGEHMMTIIDEILDISKIEAGQLELDVTDFDFHATIREACAIAGLLAESKGIQFDVQIADDVPQYGCADRRRLRQILLNLVSNAVKFTADGHVAVHATTRTTPGSDPLIRVEVSDTGIGIDPAALDRLFEPFTQADASTTRSFGGTGLGLAIARELIEMMGGTIGAKPSDTGRGSTFWFELALGTPAEPGDRAHQPDTSSTTFEPLWLNPPLVLVAEDNPVNQIVAVAALKRCGCRVEVVSDGRHALDAVALDTYDAILMDCQMPDMDGYEATAQLRSRENGGRHIPVIAMTAHAMDGDRQKCLDAGMDDYISKPLRRDQLVEVLRTWIAPDAELAVAGAATNGQHSVTAGAAKNAARNATAKSA